MSTHLIAQSNFLAPTGTLLAVVLVIALLSAVIWLWALVSAITTPGPVWERAQQNQIVWVVVIAVLGIVGALLYLLIAKPALTRAAPA